MLLCVLYGVYHRRFGRLRGQQQCAEVKQFAAVDKLKIDLAEAEIEIRAVFAVENEIPFALAAFSDKSKRCGKVLVKDKSLCVHALCGKGVTQIFSEHIHAKLSDKAA